jgi:hypothetical protein
LLTIFHSPSKRDSAKKSVNDSVPQKPVSSIAAVGRIADMFNWHDSRLVRAIDVCRLAARQSEELLDWKVEPLAGDASIHPCVRMKGSSQLVSVAGARAIDVRLHNLGDRGLLGVWNRHRRSLRSGSVDATPLAASEATEPSGVGVDLPWDGHQVIPTGRQHSRRWHSIGLAQQGCGASNTPFIQVPSHFPETVITNTGCPCCV